MFKEMMRIALQRLRKDRRSFKLQRLNLMRPIMLLRLMLLIEPPLDLQQQRKLRKKQRLLMIKLSGIENSISSMVLFMKMMALPGTWGMVLKLEVSINF